MRQLRRKVFTYLKVFSPILLGSFAVLTSCGSDVVIDETAFDKVPNANAVPSRANFEKWSPSWNRDWIVAIQGSGRALRSNPTFKTQVIHSLLYNSGLSFDDASRLRAQSLLEAQVSTEVISLLGAPRLAQTAEGEVFGFGRVRFSDGTKLWSNLHELAGVSSSQGESFERGFAFDTWRALEALPQVSWVEPDIESKVFQATSYTPPDELANGDLRRRFETSKVLKAFEFAAARGLKPVGHVAIAVIDTGVDYAHPALKDAMFKNTDEAPNGKDDDNNGYIDDIYGIDASVEPNESDGGPAPAPGPADLLGPGQKCPPSKQQEPSCGHGTHVAGIIAAQAAGVSAYGICPSCRIYSFRAAGRLRENNVVIQDNAGISDLAQIRSLAYILNFTKSEDRTQLKIGVVNMSIGKYFRSRSIAFLIRSLQENNVLVVAAAGNEKTETPSYPGAFSSVVAVCATSVGTEQIERCRPRELSLRGEFGKTCFSNFGDWIDICAPGQAIPSTAPGLDANNLGNTKVEDGTSQAAPFVAGAAGYLMSFDKTLNGEAVQSLLKEFANAQALYGNRANELYSGGIGKDSSYYWLGWGALDLENALKGYKGQGTRSSINVLTNRVVGQQVKSGCVVSSVAGTGQIPFWHFFMSAPFLLSGFWFVLRFANRK